MNVSLAIVGKNNCTRQAKPQDIVNQDIKAIGLEFKVDEPGKYEIIIDFNNNDITIIKV